MENELKNHVLKTGTTTLALKFKDGIVIGADKRVTAGGIFVAHKYFDKVLQITDNIAVATSGVVSDVQLVVKLTKAELKLRKLKTKREPTVKEAANLFASITYQNIRRLSPIVAISDFIVAGKDDKGFWIFNATPDGAVIECKNYFASGSGMVVAYGVFEDSFKENMTKEEAVKLAMRALSASIERDVASGSGIDIFIIDKKGLHKEITEEIKSQYIKK